MRGIPPSVRRMVTPGAFAFLGAAEEPAAPIVSARIRAARMAANGSDLENFLPTEFPPSTSRPLTPPDPRPAGWAMMQFMTVVKDSGLRAQLPPFTDQHSELRETVHRFVSKEIAPKAAEWETAGFFHADLSTPSGG